MNSADRWKERRQEEKQNILIQETKINFHKKYIRTQQQTYL